jgi:hypothetical protein
LCLIVVALPQGKIPFAVQLNKTNYVAKTAHGKPTTKPVLSAAGPSNMGSLAQLVIEELKEFGRKKQLPSEAIILIFAGRH